MNNISTTLSNFRGGKLTLFDLVEERDHESRVDV